MPFTVRNIKADLEDIGSVFDGPPDLEFRAATKALELEQSALSYQRVPPGARFPYGHTHETQEEVYVVVRGSGRMKVDDEIVELEEWDAVRVPPGMWRGYEAGPDGLELLVIGAPNLGDDPRGDVEGRRDWWADSSRRSHTSRMDRPAPLTIAEVAAELDRSEDEVRALIRAGELQTVACGIRPGLVPRHRLDDYLRRVRRRAEDAAGSSGGT